MRDKYKPWSLESLLVLTIGSAAIPIALAFITDSNASNDWEKFLWLYITILLIIFIFFFAQDRWCCSKKDDQIDSLEPDAKKYRQNHETEITQLKDQIKALKAERSGNEYHGKHGIQPLNDKIN